MLLKVLFVCSGPLMYHTKPMYDYDGIEEMKKELPADIFNYIVDNGLVEYGSDDMKMEYPYFTPKSLPDEYIKRIISKSRLEYRDLDKYREYIIQKLKIFYPDLLTIEYVTVDPITLDPKIYGDETIMELIRENDEKYIEKYGVKMKFIDHYSTTFQEYIKYYSDEVYDVVWFLQCTNFSLVITMDDDYITDFKNILRRNGLIVHMDWSGKYIHKNDFNHPVGELIPITERFNKLPVTNSSISNREKLEWFLTKVNNIQPGVYKFKTINSQMVNMLLF